jgi:hypothetical protein
MPSHLIYTISPHHSSHLIASHLSLRYTHRGLFVTDSSLIAQRYCRTCLPVDLLSHTLVSSPLLSSPLLYSPLLSYTLLPSPLLYSPILSYTLLPSPLLSYTLLSHTLLSHTLLSSPPRHVAAHRSRLLRPPRPHLCTLRPRVRSLGRQPPPTYAQALQALPHPQGSPIRPPRHHPKPLTIPSPSVCSSSPKLFRILMVGGRDITLIRHTIVACSRMPPRTPAATGGTLRALSTSPSLHSHCTRSCLLNCSLDVSFATHARAHSGYVLAGRTHLPLSLGHRQLQPGHDASRRLPLLAWPPCALARVLLVHGNTPLLT